MGQGSCQRIWWWWWCIPCLGAHHSLSNRLKLKLLRSGNYTCACMPAWGVLVMTALLACFKQQPCRVVSVLHASPQRIASPHRELLPVHRLSAKLQQPHVVPHVQVCQQDPAQLAVLQTSRRCVVVIVVAGQVKKHADRQQAGRGTTHAAGVIEEREQ